MPGIYVQQYVSLLQSHLGYCDEVGPQEHTRDPFQGQQSDRQGALAAWTSECGGGGGMRSVAVWAGGGGGCRGDAYGGGRWGYLLLAAFRRKPAKSLVKRKAGTNIVQSSPTARRQWEEYLVFRLWLHENRRGIRATSIADHCAAKHGQESTRRRSVRVPPPAQTQTHRIWPFQV